MRFSVRSALLLIDSEDTLEVLCNERIQETTVSSSG
jgi:hypothetical protein